MDTVSGTWPELTAGESTTCTRCAPPSGAIPNAAWSTPAMFTCTRFESGAVRPVTSTLSTWPAMRRTPGVDGNIVHSGDTLHVGRHSVNRDGDRHRIHAIRELQDRRSGRPGLD